MLSRFYEIALKYNLQTVIRCNVDCPFLDVEILKKMLKIFKKKNMIISQIY